MKKKPRPEPMVGPSTTIFKTFVNILLNENRTKGENERKYIRTKEEGRRDHRRDGLPAEGYERDRERQRQRGTELRIPSAVVR